MELPARKQRLLRILAWSSFATMFLAYYGLVAWFIPSRQYSDLAFWPAISGGILMYCVYYWAFSQPSVIRSAIQHDPETAGYFGPIGRFFVSIVFAAHVYPAVHYGAPAVLSHFTGRPATAVVTVMSKFHTGEDGCLAYGLDVYSQDLGQRLICVFAKIRFKVQSGTKLQLSGTQSALGFRYDSNKTVIFDVSNAEN